MSERRQNLFFVVGANSTNEAEAVREAYLLAKQMNAFTGVKVCRCGTLDVVCQVFADGAVVPVRDKRTPIGINDENQEKITAGKTLGTGVTVD